MLTAPLTSTPLDQEVEIILIPPGESELEATIEELSLTVAEDLAEIRIYDQSVRDVPELDSPNSDGEVRFTVNLSPKVREVLENSKARYGKATEVVV